MVGGTDSLAIRVSIFEFIVVGQVKMVGWPVILDKQTICPTTKYSANMAGNYRHPEITKIFIPATERTTIVNDW